MQLSAANLKKPIMVAAFAMLFCNNLHLGAAAPVDNLRPEVHVYIDSGYAYDCCDEPAALETCAQFDKVRLLGLGGLLVLRAANYGIWYWQRSIGANGLAQLPSYGLIHTIFLDILFVLTIFLYEIMDWLNSLGVPLNMMNGLTVASIGVLMFQLYSSTTTHMALARLEKVEESSWNYDEEST